MSDTHKTWAPLFEEWWQGGRPMAWQSACTCTRVTSKTMSACDDCSWHTRSSKAMMNTAGTHACSCNKGSCMYAWYIIIIWVSGIGLLECMQKHWHQVDICASQAKSPAVWAALPGDTGL
jgi:hypothetical protein